MDTSAMASLHLILAHTEFTEQYVRGLPVWAFYELLIRAKDAQEAQKG